MPTPQSPAYARGRATSDRSPQPDGQRLTYPAKTLDPVLSGSRASTSAITQRGASRHRALRTYFFSVVVLVLVLEPGSPVMASGAVVVVDSVVLVLASGAGVVMLTAGGVTVTSVGAAGAGGSACWVCEQAERLKARMAAARMARLFMWRTPEVDPSCVQRREIEFCCACW